MDLDHLKRFYEVVRKGSLSAAAESLHISQSTLSRTIQILEEQLGVTLLIRHATGVITTPEGEKLFEFASRVVEEAKIVERFINDSPDKVAGSLTINTTPGLGANWLMQYLPSVLQEYPHLRIKIISHHTVLTLDETDLTIRPNIPSQPDVIHGHLVDLKTKLYASPQYLEQYGIPHKVEDLRYHRIVAYGLTQLVPYGYIEWFNHIEGAKGQHLRPFIETDSVEGLTRAAAAGLGITMIPPDLACFQDTELIPISLDVRLPVIPINYIYQEKFKNSKKITAFIQFLQEEIAKKSDCRI